VRHLVAPAERGVYRARSQADALIKFGEDAPSLAARGLVLTSQSWAAPQTWRTVVTQLVLVILGYLLIGIVGAVIAALVGLVHAIAVRPKGNDDRRVRPAASASLAAGAGVAARDAVQPGALLCASGGWPQNQPAPTSPRGQWWHALGARPVPLTRR
jgi:hypothetical protein